MVSIRGLIVDDDLKNITFVTERFDRAFENLDWLIHWERVIDPNEGQQIIRTAATAFDLVIVDLLFVRTDLPDYSEHSGLELISDARARSTQTFILAISSGHPQLVDLFEDAASRGAHRVVRRFEFSQGARGENSPKAIAAAIRTHLLENGTVSDVDLEADDRDPAIQSLIHEVGRPTLIQLHRGVLGANGYDVHQMSIHFLTPGASGASVCAVTAQVERVGTMRHVLKVSRAENMLKREAERGALACEILPSRWVVQQHLRQPIGPVNGWYALGVRLEERSTPLRSWLANGPPTKTVIDVFERLFVEALGGMYADNQDHADDALDILALPHYRQCRILQALSDLTEVLTHPDGGSLTNDHAAGLVADLISFVTEKHLPRVLTRSLPRSTYTTYAHGDLHGGNVLVCEGIHPSPMLIDPSEFERAHWATDPACLAVDLLLRSIDGGAESMFFKGFERWRTLASRFGDGAADLGAATTTGATRAALFALSWIAANLRRFCPAIETPDNWAQHRWEWHITLATYLLRATYHADLPPPKRALAVVAAHDQITAAVRTLPTR